MYDYVNGNAINRLDPNGLSPLKGELISQIAEAIFGETVGTRAAKRGKEIGKTIPPPPPGTGQDCKSVCTTACLPYVDPKNPFARDDQLFFCTDACTVECEERSCPGQ